MDFDFDTLDEEDSPYPEVRASVSNVDDSEMPALTVRMWAIGLSLNMLSAAANVFFNFRYPAPDIPSLVVLLISYPLGKLCAFSLPVRTFRFPFASDFEISLNPGPWNIKEHVLVFIMANVAVSTPYAMNAIVVSELFYQYRLNYWFNLLLVLATQLTGFGLAGLCRRFLNLVVCTLLNTLHAEDDEASGGLSRYRYFLMLAGGAFFWFFLPGFLFSALSLFSWVCWMAPNNVPVNQLFGVTSGLGMGLLTFDWTEISYIGSPLVTPWWAEVHVMIGFVLFYWIVTPILYYTNVWNLSYFPISANVPYDRMGKQYDVQRVLNPDNTFNSTAYLEYSPLYLPATYAMTYLLAFALSTCVIVHTLLYHGKSLVNGFKRIRTEGDDIHTKLMRNYPEVPDWWYATSFVFFFCLAIMSMELWHTGVPVYALVLAVLLPVIYILPAGFIYAMTGQSININILAQIIPGALLPGKPLVNMIFKAYSVQTMSEALGFVQDLKLGHYIKAPPRATFVVQVTATILAAFVQVSVKQWLFSAVPDICSADQKSFLICPHNQVFFTASTIWGLIGPSRQFGAQSIYHPQLYALAIGAFLPLPFWLWQRKFPQTRLKYVNIPVLLTGIGFIPPATGINYSAWFGVAFIFQWWIRTRHFAWWSKFNYVTSAALDSGTSIAVLVIFFCLQFPRGGFTVTWWGNTVFENSTFLHHSLRRPLIQA
ncbi:OPT superfamily oligopeptide transporter [Sistotremastrum suecicum HHB10207 ss-3]|uniref:OPT superfamily oligopeptide transporter n=1 Tax=Sistotremastrum suecicum HHB10207 ss-3 TaxID=1314776 RepID=A0A166FB39_9AGAM|nr:OPT superfamily oligopeptide transporter [Sistotremastrum suecicum HHB10207 ss-3]